jgi:Leucine-rich repeat (LRR) protein
VLDGVVLDARVLWAFQVELSLVKKREFYTPRELLEAGYTVHDLFKAGYLAEELFSSGVKLQQLLDCGFSVEALRDVAKVQPHVESPSKRSFHVSRKNIHGENGNNWEQGEQERKLNDSIYLHAKSLSPSTVLRSVQSNPEHLHRLGVSLSDLISANLSVIELRSVGFTAEEIYQAGKTNINEFIQAGFHLDKLVTLFPLHILRKAGYLFEELRHYGVSLPSLLHAGYVEEVERKALSIFFSAMQGEFWVSRQNWCVKGIHVKLWFGITTQRDELDRERVAAIDLMSNNLYGQLPAELCFLQGLQRLQLAGNVLLPIDDESKNFNGTPLNFKTGGTVALDKLARALDTNRSIPAKVRELIVKNKVSTDVMAYSSISSHTIGNISHSLSSDNVDSNNALTSTFGLATPPSSYSKKLGTVPHGLLQVTSPNRSINKGKDASQRELQLVTRALFDACFEETPSVRKILQEFYLAMHGRQWRRNDGWNSDAPLHTWFGLKIAARSALRDRKQQENPETELDDILHDQVLEIILPQNNVKGILPESLRHFPRLRILDLRFNHISGIIPASLGECFSLQKLHLQSNKLSGLLPPSLSELRELTILDVRSNLLHGDVPRSFQAMVKLKYLGLQSNKFELLNAEEVTNLLPACKIVLH